jgi:hypothetical protein
MSEPSRKLGKAHRARNQRSIEAYWFIWRSGIQKARTSGSRTIRKWIGEESEIPYAAWALLCEIAGLGIIWRDKQTAEPAFVMPESLTPELIKQTREQAGLTQTQAWQGWETPEELAGHRKMDTAFFELFKIKIAQLNLVKNS